MIAADTKLCGQPQAIFQGTTNQFMLKAEAMPPLKLKQQNLRDITMLGFDRTR